MVLKRKKHKHRPPLSVLDQSPIRSGGTAADALRETLHLARLCEALGYHRYWLAEHHASVSLAGCSPEVLLGRLGSDTKRIRIGSGGIMLPHYSPFKVAENFKLLESLYPGRIDLGVGRAPGTSHYIAAALAYGSPTAGGEYFPQKLTDLEALLRDEPLLTEGMEKARARPETEHIPELWLLGSSEDSAVLAARMGLPYSFALFINPDIREDIFQIYRAHFQPGSRLHKPRTCLCVFAVCADTEKEALRLRSSRDLWFLKLVTGHREVPFPSVREAESYPYTEQDRRLVNARMRHSVIGDPEQVKSGLEDLAERFGADELMVVSITHDFEARCLSHKMIAESWQA